LVARSSAPQPPAETSVIEPVAHQCASSNNGLARRVRKAAVTSASGGTNDAEVRVWHQAFTYNQKTLDRIIGSDRKSIEFLAWMAR
jgi:hypothetical protein